jgi:hypothetical protein
MKHALATLFLLLPVLLLLHTSANVSIRPHTSAYGPVCAHMKHALAKHLLLRARVSYEDKQVRMLTYADVC